MNNAELDNIFTYHPATPGQQINYENLRNAAKHFAQVMIDNTPDCADRSAAMRKIREAVMTANAAVAMLGAVPVQPPVDNDHVAPGCEQFSAEVIEANRV